MKYYVVSDVHGYYTQLRKALEDAGFFTEQGPCALIMCGDLLDRGAEARQLIELMLGLADAGRLIYIRGNHEDLLVQCLQEIARGGVCGIASGMSHHYRNGTWDSLLQISEMSETEACQSPDELVRRVMQSPFYQKLLAACVDHYETSHYIFTHGWIPCHMEGSRPPIKYEYRPDWRDADMQDWCRARWFNGMELACRYRITEPGKTIVCGHWHASYGHSCIEHSGSELGEDADFSPFSAKGILAIDAATPISGQINCVVIED